MLIRAKVLPRQVNADVLSELGLGLDQLKGGADFRAVTAHTAAGNVSGEDGKGNFA